MLSRPYIGSGGKEKFYSLTIWWLRERLGHVVSYYTMGLFYEHHGFFDWLSQSCAANGSESVSQTFPKCYSTHNDLVFQLKMPNSPIAKFILY